MKHFRIELTDASVQNGQDWQLSATYVIEAAKAFELMLIVNTLSVATQEHIQEFSDLSTSYSWTSTVKPTLLLDWEAEQRTHLKRLQHTSGKHA